MDVSSSPEAGNSIRSCSLSEQQLYERFEKLPMERRKAVSAWAKSCMQTPDPVLMLPKDETAAGNAFSTSFSHFLFSLSSLFVLHLMSLQRDPSSGESDRWTDNAGCRFAGSQLCGSPSTRNTKLPRPSLRRQCPRWTTWPCRSTCSPIDTITPTRLCVSRCPCDLDWPWLLCAPRPNRRRPSWPAKR